MRETVPLSSGKIKDEKQMPRDSIARYIDHTALAANTTKDHIITLCSEAKEYHFASVCINPTWVETAASLLQGSDVKVCSVVGFPLGATTSEVKAYEARSLIEDGATEIDMVIQIGALLDNNVELVHRDLFLVREATQGAILKVIIETALLTDEQKRIACRIAKQEGADYVKTSTGFSTHGATLEDVKLMRLIVGEATGVKAAGGIRDYPTAIAMIEAGASRIGTSSGIAIIQGEK
ncbi:MAG: deoxyribose-phosphate aldolase [Sphaerochaetaceae bacterium]|jgi:deoxyribose-phosphate aldolase